MRNINRILYRFCQNNNKTDNTFGYKNVMTGQKQSMVNEVFHSVANKYDLMNDVMSIGVHRYWKNCFVQQLGNLSPRNYYSKNTQKIHILDVAGGTGDIAFKILQNHQKKNIKVIVCDINQSMLNQGKKRAEQLAYTKNQIQFICGNAQQLPFNQNYFDAYTISFGLRNVPRIRKALQQANRTLKYGGRFLCLEFSKVQHPILREFYKQYSFNVIPQIGEMITSDKQSYKYLVESIQRFLSQEELKNLMGEVGFTENSYQNLTNGIVAIHSGYKLNII